MAITLDEVAQAYFADAEFQKTRQYLLERRNASGDLLINHFTPLGSSNWQRLGFQTG